MEREGWGGGGWARIIFSPWRGDQEIENHSKLYCVRKWGGGGVGGGELFMKLGSCRSKG